MKYGEALQERSVSQWAPYNVDYNELKHLIKVNTTRDQGQAIAIPGHGDSALQRFENSFYGELWNQHDRVDLFVQSKADELSRRLREYQKKAINLIARNNFDKRQGISARRREKFSRLENNILDCGDGIKNLERFVDAQRLAFHKILKKYKKWTGSTTLGSRFTEEVLNSPKSFTKRNFSSLEHQYSVVLSLLQDSTPPQSGVASPMSLSHRDSRQEPPPRSRPVVSEPPQVQQQKYWNEYDDGSEAGDLNEPYTIYVNPDVESTFPGAKSVMHVFNRLNAGVKAPMEKVKAWLSPHSTTDERRPLIPDREVGYFTTHSNGVDTDAEDDASSSDFPAGYDAHYATLPSISDQRLFRHREELLFYSTVASFVAAFVLLLIVTILVFTGRHHLRVEVDAGVIVGVIASLFFATIGFAIMIYRWERLPPLHIFCVTASFLADCVLCGLLLILVMGNTKL